MRPLSPHFLRDLSIEKYLTGVAVVITAAVGLLFLVALLLISFNNAVDDANQRAKSMSDLLAFNLQAPLAFGDIESADQILESLQLLGDVRGASVYEIDGSLFSAWGDPSLENKTWFIGIPAESVVSSNVSMADEPLGKVALTFSLRPIYTEHLYISFAALMLWIIGLFIAVWLSRSLNRRVTKPLNELDKFMSRAAQSESYTERVSYDRNDELGHVVGALNNLLARVEDRDNRLSEIIEELTQARDAAEASAQAKTSFLANMSHEVRTPMNGIVGLIDLVKLEGLNTRQEAWVASMGRSADALLTIIDDILDFTRIEAGQLEIRPSVFELEPCVSSVKALFTDQIKRRGIELNIEISEQAPAFLVADQGRIRQILVNLVGNAFKFTEEGHITLVATTTNDESRMRFEVIDTGIGIDAAQHDLVFSRFQQIDTGLTRRYGGAGLGLSICSQLVSLMGGDIGFESTPNEGSRFWFEIPLETLSRDEVEGLGSDETTVSAIDSPAFTESKDKRPLTVLVAEDSEVNQFIVTELLKKLGAVVTVVSDGQQAVDAVDETVYDVILMDISMPVKDGLAATKEILTKAENTDWAPYIIGLSAHAMVGDKERAISEGMREYLTKPISLESLATALQNFLEKQQPQDNEETPYDN
jgi:signal transduction histidine kinase/ActR/RegA family two-component response regulator